MSLCHPSVSRPVWTFLRVSSINISVHAAITESLLRAHFHFDLFLNFFFLKIELENPYRVWFPDRGYIRSARVSDWRSLRWFNCMQAADRRTDKVEFCFQRSLHVPLWRRHQATRPRREILAERKEWRMKTIGFGHEWRSNCYKRKRKTTGLKIQKHSWDTNEKQWSMYIFKKKTENESAKHLKPKEIYSKLTAHKWFSMWQVLDGPSWCQAHTSMHANTTSLWTKLSHSLNQQWVISPVLWLISCSWGQWGDLT